MTVGELKKILAGYPDNHLLIIQTDGEGNGFSPLCDTDAAFYQENGRGLGDVYQEDDEDTPEDAVPCIVLVPTN